ncbi:MAG: anti-sigma factor [Bacteroidia bacterium]
MDKEALYQQIESFLDGNLSTEEQLAFEKQLATDIDLEKEVKLHQALQESFADPKTDAFTAQLKELGIQYSTGPQKNQTIKWYWMAAAASILLFAAWFVFQSLLVNSSQDLFADNYQPYPLSGNLRSDTQPKFEDYQLGLEAYQAKKYTEALNAFEKDIRPSPPLIQLLRSICMIEINNAQGAIPILDTLSHNQNHIYQNEAKWYLALAYLATDQPEKSQILLKELSVLRSKVGEQAKNILEELE